MAPLADHAVIPGALVHTLCAVLVLVPLLAGPGFSAGQAVGIKHPVLKHDLDPARAAEYERAVAGVMAMSEAQMLAFVPDRPFCRFCYCPHCHAGYPADTFTWTVQRPDELRCKQCGTTYPNAAYPDDQVMTGPNALGESFSYPFQVDKQTGIRIFLPAHLLMHRRNWIVGQCRALGIAYQATHKPEYAYRAALILDRIAQVYPHYPVMDQWITTFYIAKSQQPPYPYAGGKWGRWAEDELPAGVPEAYDLVYDSDQFDRLSRERGYDVRERFERDFLKATFAYEDTFGAVINAGNIAPYSLMTAVAMGKVINEPHYVHWAYNWLKEILYGGCFYDGMWKEAPSYHYQTISRVKADFDALTGYSDPPGFVDPADGKHFDKLEPLIESPFIATALHAPEALDFPNGCSTPVHDTWPGERRSQPRQQTVSTICPGYGHASLGRGEGPDQMKAQLHFSGAYGHSHLDSLSLTLWAKERELLCDLGYNHTRVRYWNSCTLSHNLVAIDRQDQTSANSDGDLLWFFPDTAGVSAVEADGRRAYSAIKDLDTYRRLLVAVPVSATDAYVVDLFRTRGGRTHDWLLHGDADRDMTAECNVALQPREGSMLEPGEKWEEPRDEQSRFNAYGAIREVKQGQTEGQVQVRFSYPDDPSRGLRLHVLGGAPTQVFLGQSPSVRRSKNDPAHAFDFWMPQLILRRQGEGTLTSLFAAVEEPYAGRPFLTGVQPLAVTPADAYVAALQVSHGDGVDTIISTLDDAPYPERVAGGVRLQGRLGIVRRQAGKVVAAWLLQGESLSGEGFGVTCQTAAYTGEIEGALRRADGQDVDGLLTSAALPAGDVLRGLWLIVTHPGGMTHGYEIVSVRPQEGKTLIVLKSDHGLQIAGDKTQEVFFPRRTFTGRNTFRLSTAVGVRRTDAAVWQAKLGSPVTVEMAR
jgi:hypothetical protein